VPGNGGRTWPKRGAGVGADDELIGYLGLDQDVCTLPAWPNAVDAQGCPVRMPHLHPGRFNSQHGLAVGFQGASTSGSDHVQTRERPFPRYLLVAGALGVGSVHSLFFQGSITTPISFEVHSWVGPKRVRARRHAIIDSKNVSVHSDRRIA
jgi:hypothetical protein